jgi:hypothetical protein
MAGMQPILSDVAPGPVVATGAAGRPGLTHMRYSASIGTAIERTENSSYSSGRKRGRSTRPNKVRRDSGCRSGRIFPADARGRGGDACAASGPFLAQTATEPMRLLRKAQDQSRIATPAVPCVIVSGQQKEPSGNSRPKRVDVNLKVDGVCFKLEEQPKYCMSNEP